MLYTRGTVSTKSWEPIFNLRCRPYRVQEVVLDLLKQLTALRKMPCMLPSIDTISLSLNRQLRVTFGDMDGLCDAIQSLFHEHGPLGVAYGGPDDRGTLWIQFYKMWAADRTRANHLQFTIWIDSLLPSSLAFEDDEMPVCVKPPSQPKPRQFKFVNYQPQKPLVPEHSAKPKRLHGGGIREYLVREYPRKIAESEAPKA